MLWQQLCVAVTVFLVFSEDFSNLIFFQINYNFVSSIFVELSSGFGAKEYDYGQGRIKKCVAVIMQLL